MFPCSNPRSRAGRSPCNVNTYYPLEAGSYYILTHLPHPSDSGLENAFQEKSRKSSLIKCHYVCHKPQSIPVTARGTTAPHTLRTGTPNHRYFLWKLHACLGKADRKGKKRAEPERDSSDLPVLGNTPHHIDTHGDVHNPVF